MKTTKVEKSFFPNHLILFARFTEIIETLQKIAITISLVYLPTDGDILSSTMRMTIPLLSLPLLPARPDIWMYSPLVT